MIVELFLISQLLAKKNLSFIQPVIDPVIYDYDPDWRLKENQPKPIKEKVLTALEEAAIPAGLGVAKIRGNCAITSVDKSFLFSLL